MPIPSDLDGLDHRAIRTVLIANRGEIACRVIRTAREMGISTVAVFSDADADAVFVKLADVAVRLPGVSPADTYLRGDLIVEAALRTGADAIHPGYGFLSENADFAQRVTDAGLIFVGPSAAAIAAMGSKIRSKELMAASGVPVLPGVTVTGSADDDLAVQVEHIGYPLLVKASAGGGGRGMRIVESPTELAEAVASARREAGSAFGDDTVFIEKYVTAPRHIEVQIFGDRHGNVVHLFERECSIQRRYQKIIEEAPSPAVTPELRERLGAAAVAAGRALDYVGAGTVEFILDAAGDFHFLEVNTRLQVEHPVTEFVTGLDLVRLQFLVAQGEPLPREALEAEIRGHAIEARLYAEDPAAGFLPTSGTLRALEVPATVRLDSGFVAGDTVSIHYDPLLAKVIAYAQTRTEAALALASALRRSRVHGVRTNRELLVGILGEAEFLAGEIDTAYLERHTVDELVVPASEAEERLAAFAAGFALRKAQRSAARVQQSITADWRNVPSQPILTRLAVDGVDHDVRIGRPGSAAPTVDGVALGGEVRVSVATLVEPVETQSIDEISTSSISAGSPISVVLEVDGVRRVLRVARQGELLDVDGPGGSFEFREVDLLPQPGSAAAPGSLAAPMPGTVTRIEVEVGSAVDAGQVIVVLEAMKMEHSVRAPTRGVVEELRVTVGQQVDVGEVLAVTAEPEASETEQAHTP